MWRENEVLTCQKGQGYSVHPGWFGSVAVSVPMTRGDDAQDRYRAARAAGLAVVIPFLMLAAPLVGLFGGQWLDGRLGTDPWLMYAGLVLGMIAGGRETYLLVRRMMRDLDKL